MPEMVSLFNGMGGACAVLISIVEFNHLYEILHPHLGEFASNSVKIEGSSSSILFDIISRFNYW